MSLHDDWGDRLAAIRRLWQPEVPFDGDEAGLDEPEEEP